MDASGHGPPVPAPEPLFLAAYERHYRAICRLAERIVGDRQEAENIAGDAFEALLKRPATTQFDSGFAVRRWLERVTERMAFEHVRRRRRLPVMEAVQLTRLRDELQDLAGPACRITIPNEELRAKVNALPDLLRAVVELHDYQDLTFEQLAGPLGYPDANTARQAHFRALTHLRRWLVRSPAEYREIVAATALAWPVRRARANGFSLLWPAT